MSVADRAIVKIRNLIIEGQFGPGDRLPAEAELAALLEVSRNALREAVRALCAARVLEIRRGDGTFVSNLEPGTLLGGLEVALGFMHESTMLEIFEVRRLLEPAATGLAATRATPEDVARLEGSLHRMTHADDDGSLIDCDLEFHHLVAEITDNSTLCALIDALGRQAMHVRTYRGVVQKGSRNFTFEQHKHIVDAIRLGDATLAAAASTVHVTQSETWLRRVLEGQEL